MSAAIVIVLSLRKRITKALTKKVCSSENVNGGKYGDDSIFFG